jgi:hypothetical protein
VWLLALFVAVQLADAAMTLAGVQRFGPIAEGNPLLAFCIVSCGATKTIVTAKCGAVVLATGLYARACYLVLAALTVVYVFGAIGPWAWWI